MQIDASDLPVISGQTWCLCYKWNSTFISVYCNRQMVTFPNTKAVYFLILFLLARWKIVPILVHRAYAITEMIMLQSYFLLYPNNLWSSCIYLFLVGEVLWIPLSELILHIFFPFLLFSLSMLKAVFHWKLKSVLFNKFGSTGIFETRCWLWGYLFIYCCWC